MKDLLADRGDQLQSSDHELMLGQDEISPGLKGYSDADIGLMDEHDFVDVQEAEGEPGKEAEAEPEVDEETIELSDDTILEIPNIGDVSVADIAEAFSALETLDQDRNQLAQQRAELSQDAARIQQFLANPQVRQIVEYAVSKGLADPSILQGVAGNAGRQNGASQQQNAIPEQFREAVEYVEIQKGQQLLEETHAGLKQVLGDAYDDAFKNQVEKQALKEFRNLGREPSRKEIEAVALRLAVTKGIKNTPPEEVERALRHRRATRVATGSSSRSAISGNRRIDPLRLNDQQVQRLAEIAFSGGDLPEV